MIVRKFLWAQGFRYRLNHPRLPGKPDIVLRRYRTCIFVNGCFWHGHNVIRQLDDLPLDNMENSECCKIPHTRREFWVSKILRNQERDIEVQKRLAEMGWHSVTVWECELKPAVREKTLESLAYTLNHIFLMDAKRNGLRNSNADSNSNQHHGYVLPEEELQMAAEPEGIE